MGETGGRGYSGNLLLTVVGLLVESNLSQIFRHGGKSCVFDHHADLSVDK